jgi:CRP/FNR family transcriptional regulator
VKDSRTKLQNLINSLFREEELTTQLLGCKLLEIQGGEQLLKEGDYIKVVPLILSGSVKVIRTDENGREILLYHINSGESCALSISAVLNADSYFFTL